MSAKNNQNTYEAVQVLIDTGEGWLLDHRQNKTGIFWPNCYGLWGGSFEAEDEHNSLKAALRELYEEAQLTSDDLEIKKLRVVDYENKVFIDSPSAPTKVHFYYAKLKEKRFVHSYEGDISKIFPYGTKFENEANFTPYVADAVHLAERIKNEAQA